MFLTEFRGVGESGLGFSKGWLFLGGSSRCLRGSGWARKEGGFGKSPWAPGQADPSVAPGTPHPPFRSIPLIPPASITAADPFPDRAPRTQTDTRRSGLGSSGSPGPRGSKGTSANAPTHATGCPAAPHRGPGCSGGPSKAHPRCGCFCKRREVLGASGGCWGTTRRLPACAGLTEESGEQSWCQG